MSGGRSGLRVGVTPPWPLKLLRLIPNAENSAANVPVAAPLPLPSDEAVLIGDVGRMG